MAHFDPKPSKQSFFQKLLLLSILSLYATATSCKKSKNLVLHPFWTTLAKKPQNKSFPKNVVEINFKLISYYNSMQKTEKFLLSVFHKNLKNHILGPFWSFWLDLKTGFFPKKSFSSILRLYITVTSCKKFYPLIFHYTWKTLFWVHFWSFFAQKLWVRFISKNVFPSLF